MKTMKRVLALLLMVVVCCTLTACKKDENANAETTATQAPVSAGNPDDVMLSVGDYALKRSEYEGYLTVLKDYYTNYGYDVTDASILNMLQQFALQTGIEYAVMDQQVAALNLGLTEDEKTAAIAEAKAEWDATIQDGLTYYGVTEESTEEERSAAMVTVLAELETMGYTEENYLADAVKYGAYNKLKAEVTKDVTVTDEDVTAYYNALVEEDKAAYENNAAAYEQAQYMNQMYAMYGMSDYVTPLYYKPAGYRLVTHILLEADEELLTAYTDLQAAYEEQQLTLEEGGELTEEAITAEEIENARLAILANVQPKVDEINQKLADGASFADLIPEYTTDPGMNTADAIAAGYEVHMDSANWVIPFRDQAFTVDNIGDVTAPVVTDYGVHILQYVADVPGGPVELTDEMRAAFLETLKADKENEVYAAALSTWTTEANITYSAEAQEIMGLVETPAAE